MVDSVGTEVDSAAEEVFAVEATSAAGEVSVVEETSVAEEASVVEEISVGEEDSAVEEAAVGAAHPRSKNSVPTRGKISCKLPKSGDFTSCTAKVALLFLCMKHF